MAGPVPLMPAPAPVAMASPPPAPVMVAPPTVAPPSVAPVTVEASPPAPPPPQPGLLSDVPVAYLSSLTLPAIRLLHELPRLTLSNYDYDTVRVQVVVTPFPDCEFRPGITPAEFILPLNATRILQAPAGADICWRREVVSATQPDMPAHGVGWGLWNRAYMSNGHSVDASL